MLLPKAPSCPVGETGTSLAKALLSEMDADGFAALLDGFRERKGVLRLPKFRLDAFLPLNDALEALGLGELFDSSALPVDALVEDAPLYVTEALQKASIDVSETGTTAAAVTVIKTEEGALVVPNEEEPFEMTCDRPFAFVLYGADGTILFTGCVFSAPEGESK